MTKFRQTANNKIVNLRSLGNGFYEIPNVGKFSEAMLRKIGLVMSEETIRTSKENLGSTDENWKTFTKFSRRKCPYSLKK